MLHYASSVDIKTVRLVKENNMQVRVAEPGKKIGTCGCGRSPTGDCIGWHGLNEEEYQERLAEYKAFNVKEDNKNELG